jgi:hypothetical protein
MLLSPYDERFIQEHYREYSDTELARRLSINLPHKRKLRLIRTLCEEKGWKRSEQDKKKISRQHPARFGEGNQQSKRVREVGTIFRRKSGPWYIKTIMPYTRFLWEQAHGTVPPGMVVVKKNRIRKVENLRVEHLEIISRRELAHRNYNARRHRRSARKYWRRWREMKKQLLYEQLGKINPLLEEQAELQALVDDYYRFAALQPGLKKTNQTIRSEERLREIKVELQKLMIEYYRIKPIRSVDESFKKFPI